MDDIFKDFEKTSGVYPDSPDSDESNIYGGGFYAYRAADRFVLSWPAGGFMTEEVEAEITEEEFTRLRDDPGSFYEIRFTHDPYR